MLLKNYLWLGESWLNEEEVNAVRLLGESKPPEEGKTGTGPADPDAPPDNDEKMIHSDLRQSVVSWFDIRELPSHVSDKINSGVDRAMCESDWYHKLEYMETLQYTTYEGPEVYNGEGQDFYTWHTDHGGEIGPDGMHRKMSFSIQLSDPDDYEGGHFQWIEHYEQFNSLEKNSGEVNLDKCVRTVPFRGKAKGTMIVFPSFVYHQVTPVTKGIRKSLVGWIHGYPYV